MTQNVILFSSRLFTLKKNNNNKYHCNYTRRKEKLIITYAMTYIVKRDGLRTIAEIRKRRERFLLYFYWS